MNLQNFTRVAAITSAGFLLAAYQFTPTPSWACSASGGVGYSYGAQTSATSITVCAKAVVQNVSTSAAKPAAPTQTKPKPAPKPEAKPVAKPTPVPAPKPAAKPSPKMVLLTPIKVGVPVTLQKPVVPSPPKSTPKPSAPVKAPVTPKPSAPVIKVATTSSSGEASFSPAGLVILASSNSVDSQTQVTFSTNAMQHFKIGSLLGKSTQVQFVPGQPNWSFGDGISAIGSSVNHRFATQGSHIVYASVVYAVSYRISGETNWVESGSITVADSISVLVASVANPPHLPTLTPISNVRLVGQNCAENPHSFGCST